MNIRLRKATASDLPLTMAWRSNPLVYEGFYQQDRPLEWNEHSTWWMSRNRDWRNFIIMFNDRPVGAVTIGQLDHWSPEIGYYIGEVSLWGRGIGNRAVQLGLDFIREYGREHCHTTVLEQNERSIKLLRRLGFEIKMLARGGEVWLTKEL